MKTNGPTRWEKVVYVLVPIGLAIRSYDLVTDEDPDRRTAAIMALASLALIGMIIIAGVWLTRRSQPRDD